MTLLAPTDLDRPLSAAMREGSQAEHRDAEGSAFMTELLAGRIGPAGYAAYLLRLRQVYDTMETTARQLQHHPAVAAVLDPALERVPAIDADLDHWVGLDPTLDLDAVRAVGSPAAARYAARIAATTSDPVLLVAHHYTRYLGDLSGGQAIGRILDREHELGGRGIAFYDFSAIGKPKPYKDAYRSRLDALGLDGAETSRVVDEVRAAFALNQALFAELDPRGTVEA